MPSSSSSTARSSSSPAAASSSWSPETGSGRVPPSTATSSPAVCAKQFVSSLVKQKDVDAVCKKYGVSKNQYSARCAGDLRACDPPPEGSVCVYERALEAGMRIPMHGFFIEVLLHFGLAPTQLTPNGWRLMAGFLVLCHSAGVRLSLALFRHFFCLSVREGWFHFRGKDTAGALFTKLPKFKGWKRRFFFLTSRAPWPFRVSWGVPQPRSSKVDPVLTEEDNTSVAKLLGGRGSPIDLQTYLCKSKLAAAFSSTELVSLPLPAARTQGTKSFVNNMTQIVPAAGAGVQKVKTESDTPGCSTLSGKKRTLEEANANEGVPVVSSPPAAHGCSADGARSVPRPGLFMDNHDMTETEAARTALRDILTPSQERVFAAAKPSDIIKRSYLQSQQALISAWFSVECTMDLEQKVTARKREDAVLRGELEELEARIAKAQGAVGAVELENAQAVAVQEFLASEEHAGELKDHAMKGYKLGVVEMRDVVLQHNRVSTARGSWRSRKGLFDQLVDPWGSDENVVFW